MEGASLERTPLPPSARLKSYQSYGTMQAGEQLRMYKLPADRRGAVLLSTLRVHGENAGNVSEAFLEGCMRLWQDGPSQPPQVLSSGTEGEWESHPCIPAPHLVCSSSSRDSTRQPPSHNSTRMHARTHTHNPKYTKYWPLSLMLVHVL